MMSIWFFFSFVIKIVSSSVNGNAYFVILHYFFIFVWSCLWPEYFAVRGAVSSMCTHEILIKLLLKLIDGALLKFWVDIFKMHRWTKRRTTKNVISIKTQLSAEQQSRLMKVELFVNEIRLITVNWTWLSILELWNLQDAFELIW